jgi:hypothetical protein
VLEPFEMYSQRKFIFEGLKQAGLVFGLIVLFIFLIFLGISFRINGEIIGKIYVFLIATLGGAIPLVLFQFDISNKLIAITWISLILPYWGLLGASAGFITWKNRASDDEQIALPKNEMRIYVVILSVLMGLISMMSLPSFVSSGSSIENAVINNLRQIDAAKNQFALEKKVSPDYIPTEVDLTPYIHLRDGKFPHVGEERYVLNPIRENPYAILDKDWRIRRHGLREGYTITNGTIYRLP